MANREQIKNTGKLEVGTSLTIPTVQQLERQFPEYAVRAAEQLRTTAEQRIYVTKSGDTLFDIARRQVGQGSRFAEIMTRNDQVLPAKVSPTEALSAGLRLVLPESPLQ